MRVRLVFSRRQLRAGAAALSLVASFYALGAAAWRFGGSYPAPAGVYDRLVTLGNTVLGQSGGVGIGTSASDRTLNVGGDARLGGSLTAAGGLRFATLARDPANGDGAFYYNASTHALRWHEAGAWAEAAGGGALRCAPFDDPKVNVRRGRSNVALPVCLRSDGGNNALLWCRSIPKPPFTVGEILTSDVGSGECETWIPSGRFTTSNWTPKTPGQGASYGVVKRVLCCQ